jgi:hypothetical protein
MRRRLLLLFAAAAAACDPAVRTDSRAGAAPASDLRSRELETCSRSADCAAELRCFDGACRPGKAPVAAELQSAVGDRALAAGKPRDAAAAYALAVGEFEKEKLAVPVELLCNHARALVADLGDRGEQAARTLHRCLLGAPVGSQVRRRAMTDVAALVELGLDPAVMGRAEPADSYPFKAPPAPAADALAVVVAVQSRSRAGSLKRFQRALETRPEVKAALASCWKPYWEATHKAEMKVTIAYRYGFDLDALGDLDHTWIRAADAEAPADPAEAEATRCTRAALEQLASSEGRKMGEEARWDAAMTFTVAPGGT